MKIISLSCTCRILLMKVFIMVWWTKFLIVLFISYVQSVHLDTSLEEVRQEILDTHNKLRANVDPPAANMLIMTWDDNAAKEAQNLSDSCDFNHKRYEDTIFGRNGQNIAYSTSGNWTNAIYLWYNEVNDFTYGSKNSNGKVTGHYTQLVWATSHKVGCAATHCSFGDYFVCNYLPAGNRNGHSEFPYKKGPFCQDCPNDCSGNLCTNACENGADIVDNCEQLTPMLTCPNKYCMASCKCQNKITWKFPYDNMEGNNM